MTVLILEQKFEPIEYVMDLFDKKETKEKFCKKEKIVCMGLYGICVLFITWELYVIIVRSIYQQNISFYYTMMPETFIVLPTIIFSFYLTRKSLLKYHKEKYQIIRWSMISYFAFEITNMMSFYIIIVIADIVLSRN
jgi:membrane protease YdiL (CAAX protease family)